MTLYTWPYIYRRRLETTPSDLRILKTSLRSVFKIHEDPRARSLTYTCAGFAEMVTNIAFKQPNVE